MLIFRLTTTGILLLSALLAGCSSEPDCMTSDIVREVAQVDDTQHIYVRVSGFQEREYFYELYHQKPTFGDCGTSDIEPLDVAHIDHERGAPDAIVLQQNGIEIQYGEDGTFSETELAQVVVMED